MKKVFTLNHPTFHPQQQHHYKLKNNQNNEITTLKEGQVLVKQIKAESAIRTTKAFSIHHLVTYFQMEILELSSFIGIGVTADSSENTKLYSKSKQTVYVLGNELYHNGKKLEIMGWKQKANDRIGCGYIPHQDKIFFTYNGEEFKPNVKLECEGPFYGVVGLKNTNDCIKWITDQKQFVYKLEDKVQSLQKQIRKKLEKHRIKKKNQEQLIFNYLSFSGYNRTAELYEKSVPNSRFTPYEYKQNPSFNPVISLNVPQFQSNFGEFQFIDPSSSESSSSVSEERLHFGDSSPSEESYESSSSEEEWYSIDTFLRKEHYLPQNERTKKIRHPEEIKKLKKQRKERKKREKKEKIQKMKKEKKEEMEDQENPNQEFILFQLPKILSDIKEGQFEQAQSSLVKKLPQLFKLQKYLEAYFLAHVFFRIIKKQGPLAAIEYAKNRPEFKENENVLFPFYNDENQQVQERPLKEILLRLEGKFNEVRQYDIFSQFIRELILRKMGYHCHSQLELYRQHYGALKEWMKKLQVRQGGVVLMQ